jgi:hypothetical protein
MKTLNNKLGCIIFLFYAFSMYSSAQTLLNENKIWSQVNYRLPSFTAITEHFTLDKDTMVNGIVYQKLLRSTDKNQQNWNEFLLVRETVEGYIYFKPDTSQNEYMFYRPDTQVGDTISLSSIESYNGGKYIGSYSFRIENRDSILLNGLYRKRVILRRVNAPVSQITYFVEGIGSTTGLLHWETGLLGGDSYLLICCSDNGTLIYHDPKYSNCYYVWNGSENRLLQPNLVNIAVNPGYMLKVDMVEPNSGRFSVFDVKGRIVLREAITSRSSTYLLPTRGLHLYRFEAENGQVQTGKVLVK